jgi:hypothetical protein
MPRNQTLGSVRYAVKAETAKALDSTATADDSQINQVIFDVQQWLASEYDWPFLRSRWDVVATPGSRYLAYPTVDDVNLATAINFERAGDLQVYVKWNNVWQEVPYGIREMEEFNYIDSDRGIPLDPIQRWMFDDESNFEIWPIPASAQTVRFVGQRVLTELRTVPVTTIPTWNDAALLDLDDLMVKYFAAAEYLTRKDQPGIAKLLLDKAKNRMQMIRMTYPKLQQPCIVGGATMFDRRALRIVPMVVVGGK